MLADVTNIEKQQHLKTKQLESQSKSPKKRAQNQQQCKAKFMVQWINLEDYEKEIMSEKCSTFSFSQYEQFLWFQGLRLHFVYPQKLEHGNTQKSLEKHRICEAKRHSLLCWMGYVLGSYQNASNETYFLAISLFDKFLQIYQQQLTNQELLSVGICCLSLASKQKDIYSLTSKQLMHLSGDKMNENLLAQCQIKILETINYQVEQPNYFQFFDYMMRDLEYRYFQITNTDIVNNSLAKQKFIIIYKFGLLILRFVAQHYDTTMYKQTFVAYSCIYLTLQHMENQNYILPSNLNELLLQIKEEQEIANVDIVIKYVQMLCKYGLSEKQKEFFLDTYFNY